MGSIRKIITKRMKNITLLRRYGWEIEIIKIVIRARRDKEGGFRRKEREPIIKNIKTKKKNFAKRRRIP